MKRQLQQTQLELQSSQDVISDMISSSFLGESDEDISNVHPSKKMKTSSENNSPSVKSNEKNDDNDCGQLSDENDPLQKSTPDLFK